MKHVKLLIIVFLALSLHSFKVDAQDIYQVASPDETVVLTVSTGDSLYVSLSVDGVSYARTTVGLDVRGFGAVGNAANVLSEERSHVEGEIKVIEGEKGLFIAMPSRKAADGEYRDIAHPINSETRDKIQSLILEKYQESASETEE